MRLRTRVMVSFALGAALLSILLSGATYLLTRRNLLEQRETAAVSQAYRDAHIMQSQITNPTATSTQLSAALQSVVTGAGSHPVIEDSVIRAVTS